jgi:thiamine pyrophosphate-dependent acetolactate synthase large subunit-like protein
MQVGPTGKLMRRDVVKALLEDRGELLAIGGLGAPAWDITAAGDTPLNLPLWGGMGGAAMMGLGLALAQPSKPVLVITGDGEMLMGMGSLATVGLQKPKNLTIVVLDNEVYGETGGQASHTAGNVDLIGVAKSCGIADARAMATLGEVEAYAAEMQDTASGPRFASVKIDSANLERVLSSRDGTFIVNRLRGSLGFSPI